MDIKRMFSVCIVFLLALNLVNAFGVSVNTYDPMPAEAGKPVNVWFKIENPSSQPEDAGSIEIIPKDGLELTSGESSEKRIGIIAGRSSQIIKYRLFVKDDAFEGSHVVEAQLSKDGMVTKKELLIEVEKKDIKDVNLAIGDVESDPTRIKPDDDNVKLKVTIQNLGDGKAQGVKAYLIDLPEGITLSESYSGSSLLGNIESDSTAIATFYIDVDKTVRPGRYTSQIKVNYKYRPDEDASYYSNEEGEIPLDISIKPVPIYNITKVELLGISILRAGQKDIKLRITIENIGEEAGESVRIKAYGKTEQPITFEKSSDFVAPVLEPGETGQATLEFKIDDDANLQKYYLDLEIKSVVNDDVITYNEKIPIIVSKPKPDNPWKVVSIGIILIAGFFGWLKYKKYKKAKRGTSFKKAGGSYGGNYLDKMNKEG